MEILSSEYYGDHKRALAKVGLGENFPVNTGHTDCTSFLKYIIDLEDKHLNDVPYRKKRSVNDGYNEMMSLFKTNETMNSTLSNSNTMVPNQTQNTSVEFKSGANVSVVTENLNESNSFSDDLFSNETSKVDDYFSYSRSAPDIVKNKNYEMNYIEFEDEQTSPSLEGILDDIEVQNLFSE